MTMRHLALVLTAVLCVADLRAAAPFTETPAQRGRRFLLTRSYNPATMAANAYDVAWKHWGVKERPKGDDYAGLFRERYGLHPAPYENGGLPMGLRYDERSFGPITRKGITTDCLICHGGSI